VGRVAVIARRPFPARLGAFLRAAARFAGIGLLVVLVVAAIDVMPALVSPTIWTLFKAPISLPAAVAIVCVRRRREVWGYTLLGVYGLSQFGLNLGGVDQHDAAFDFCALSMLALAAWLYLPFVRDWKAPLRWPRREDVLRARDLLGQARKRSTPAVAPVPVNARGRRALAIVALLIGALVAVAAAGQPAHALSVWRLPLTFLDAVGGGAATWYLARRVLGDAGGVGAAFAWMCASVRWEYGSTLDSGVSPTFLVPVLAVLAVELRERGIARGPALAGSLAALVVVASIWWPVLALVAALVVVFTLRAFGESSAARSSLLGVAGVAVSFAISCAVAGRAGHLLAAQTAFADPAHAVVACASGCDGALPWEFFYPSAFASAYAPLTSSLYAGTQHWGSYQLYAIAPGWAQLVLAAAGIAVLWRTGRRTLVRAAGWAIVAGVLLALPSHYMGLGLPSPTRLLTTLVPSFEFGAQFAILAAFFTALLAGAGFAAALRMPSQRRTATLVVLGLLVAIDCVNLPARGHPGSVVTSVAQSLDTNRQHDPIEAAFYPMLTADYGAEFDDVIATARQHGLELLNDSADADAFANLSDPSTLSRLRARGVRYVIVSLGDYPRRAEILREGHVMLPDDQDWNPAAWTAPDPTALSQRNVSSRAETGGTVVLQL
jgi:hypothetical protein